MEQKFDNELMPTIGVYCTMACADYQPPRLLSASESEIEPRLFDVDDYEFGVIYPAVLDELDPLDDGEVETVNEAFLPKCVITPGTMPIPKEGTVGYVKVESKHYEGPELKPRWFDVDEYEFEVVG